MTIRGVLAPVPTPFADDEALDLAAWRANLDRWMDTPLHGVVVLGTTGEAPFVDDDEADRLIREARARIPGDRLLVAGAGRQSTRAAIAAAHRAADAGADAVLVRTPSCFRKQLTAAAFVRHYAGVADASPVPVILYNFSAFTGVTLPVEAVAELVDHPNVVGLKESGPDLGYVGDLVGAARDGFSVLVGSAPTFYASLALGASGGILALACVLPDACVRIYEHAAAGRHGEARALQRQVVPLARLVTTVHGVPGLKAALTALGYAGGRPRGPLAPVGADAAQEIRRRLESLAAAPAGAAP